MESAVHPDRHLPGHLSPLTAPGRAAGDRSGLFGGVRGGSGQGGLQRLRPPPTGWNGRPGPTLADRWRPKPTRSTGRPGGRGPPRGIAARHGIVWFFWFWAEKGHAAQRSGPRPGNEVFALLDRTGTGHCPVVAASAGSFRPGLVLVAPKPPCSAAANAAVGPFAVAASCVAKSSGGVQPGLGSYTPCSSGPDN